MNGLALEVSVWKFKGMAWHCQEVHGTRQCVAIQSRFLALQGSV